MVTPRTTPYYRPWSTAKTVIVSLEHERYRKLIVEVNDPAAARMLNAAIGR